MSGSLIPSQSTIASVGIGIPIATIFSWVVQTFAQVEVPGEVQAAIGAVVSAIVGYFFVGGRREDTE
jgi:uncharacterized membrane-anchored protein